MTSAHLASGDLTTIVGADHVRDAVPADAIDGVMPSWVVTPGSIEEAAAILRLASETGLAVAPRGNGTKLGLGNLPQRLDLILSTLRLNQVLEHASGDLVARLGAGVRLTDAQAVFARAGQWLALDPPEQDATMGGIIAANSFGPHRLRYGAMRDLLIGITYILADGTIAKAGGKVVKNVAGYDLCKLFTGSLGTLGLIVEVIVRLHPLPAASRTVLVGKRGGPWSEFDDMARVILQSTLVPSSMVCAPGRQMFAVLFEGIEPGVESQSRTAMELLQTYGEVHIERTEDVASAWQIDSPADHDGHEQAELKISVLPAQTSAAIADIMSSNKQRSEPAVIAYAGTGLLRVHLSAESDALVDSIHSIRRRLRGREAHVVVTTAPPAVKQAIDVWGDAGNALPLMRRVKARFDPRGTLNPGRFVGGI